MLADFSGSSHTKNFQTELTHTHLTFSRISHFIFSLFTNLASISSHKIHFQNSNPALHNLSYDQNKSESTPCLEHKNYKGLSKLVQSS